jgi:cation transport ATPase
MLTKSGRRAVYVQVVWLFAPRLNGMLGVLALETESARRRRFPVVQKYFTPTVGAVLMSASTVVVVINAQLLKWVKTMSLSTDAREALGAVGSAKPR